MVKKQTFIQGALILLAAGIINRILGFVPRITLPRVIGAEGVGLYQLGYPFLIVILTVISGGIPLAVSKLVAEAESEGQEYRVRSILRTALIFTASLGILLTAVCLLAAKWITSHLMTDPRVYYTFLCMSPVILIVPVSAVFRGYFQGRQNMIPTALSQMTETLIRIVAVLACALLMLPYGIEFAAAGAMFGVLLGELGGLMVILHHYRRSRDEYEAGPAQAAQGATIPLPFMDGLRRLLKISVPVTAGKLVSSCSYLLESILLVQSLAIAGVAAATATAQYGMLQGMVIPILYLPSALTYSLAVSLVPSLSEAAAKGQTALIRKRLHQSLRLSLVSGAPFAVIMYLLAEPLCIMLYNDAKAGAMLKLMAPAALFIYFQAPLQATLQALDQPGKALRNTLIGAFAKLGLILALASRPEYGIVGAVAAINVNIMLVTILNYNSVSRLLGFSMKLSDFVKVGASMLIMGIGLHAAMREAWLPSPTLQFLLACAAGCLLYLIGIFALRLVDSHDLTRIPGIRRKK